MTPEPGSDSSGQNVRPVPVRLEVILEVCRPCEGAAAALEGAAQDLLGQRAAAAAAAAASRGLGGRRRR